MTRRHVPALDGVRGLALTLVLLVHFSRYLGLEPSGRLDDAVYRVCSAGWCGVDLFFVLSGFLITGILLDTRDGARPLYRFYARRFLRIFPPYYVFLTLYFVVVPRVPPHIVPPEAEVQGWYWSYLANVRDAVTGWRDPGLVHFWSLAVEEQFYLAWPFLVLRFPIAEVRRACVALIAIAPLLRVACFFTHAPEAAYVLTPCRMDALAAGALVAVVVRDPATRDLAIVPLAKRAAWASLAVVAAIAIAHRGMFWHFDPLVYTLGMSATSIGFAALVARAAYDRGSIVERIFSFAPLRAIGKYSYAMYILHVPVLGILVLAQLDLRHAKPIAGSFAPVLAIDFAIVVPILFLMALASWHLYEKRVLALKRYFEDAPATERAASAVIVD